MCSHHLGLVHATAACASAAEKKISDTSVQATGRCPAGSRAGSEDASGKSSGEEEDDAIHRHLLEILLEYIGRLLAFLDPWAPGRRQFERRADQARERLQFLERGWPESKRIVLPRLRAAEDAISVDSRSEVETLAISFRARRKQFQKEYGNFEYSGCFSILQVWNTIAVRMSPAKHSVNEVCEREG